MAWWRKANPFEYEGPSTKESPGISTLPKKQFSEPNGRAGRVFLFFRQSRNKIGIVGKSSLLAPFAQVPDAIRGVCGCAWIFSSASIEESTTKRNAISFQQDAYGISFPHIMKWRFDLIMQSWWLLVGRCFE